MAGFFVTASMICFVVGLLMFFINGWLGFSLLIVGAVLFSWWEKTPEGSTAIREAERQRLEKKEAAAEKEKADAEAMSNTKGEISQPTIFSVVVEDVLDELSRIIDGIESVEDAKLAVKKFRLKKKELTLAKKEIIQQQQKARAMYTDKTRRQGSKIRGGGTFGKLIRLSQTIQRDEDRRALADSLEPLEQQKNSIDMLINNIDRMIIDFDVVE